ncbi:MAG TPA: PAS domain-containing sensor histidine kinase [Armatimonadota bacterium]|jgi:PAS domain S-box-containing protein
MISHGASQGVTEAQLASIVASATDAIISVDTQQNIILYNRAAETMFLRPAAEALGQPLNTLIPERFHEAHQKHVARFGRSGITSRSMQSPGQLLGLRSNGEEFPVEAMISHADTEDGRIYSVIIRDITERVRLETARQEFLALLGHELRNPLAAISSALYLARRRVDDAALERPLDILDRQVSHMTRLVSDLVDVSRVTRGVLDIQREELDIISVLGSAIEPFRRRFADGGIRLHVSLAKEPILLAADPVRLHQVFSNLLDNAAKYTDPGGSVWVEARRHGAVATISVRDTGVGIAPALMPRLFEPFVQGKQGADRTQSGLGLGLTLCHRIVGLHGGTFEASSAGPGEGAQFTIRLPLVA